MISFRVVSTFDGKRSEIYISVDQSQSLFDCLHEHTVHHDYWTELSVRENGMHVYGWRVLSHSEMAYPALHFKTHLDEQFQKLFNRQDRPTLEIYLTCTNQRHSFVNLGKYV
jgi:hypothetical protein